MPKSPMLCQLHRRNYCPTIISMSYWHRCDTLALCNTISCARQVFRERDFRPATTLLLGELGCCLFRSLGLHLLRGSGLSNISLLISSQPRGLACVRLLFTKTQKTFLQMFWSLCVKVPHVWDVSYLQEKLFHARAAPGLHCCLLKSINQSQWNYGRVINDFHLGVVRARTTVWLYVKETQTGRARLQIQ